MPLRQIRHQRNRRPRPSLTVSPPAGVTIDDAFGDNGSTNATTIDLTGSVAASTGSNTQFHDYTAGQTSVGILFSDANPLRIVIIWPDAQVRVGNTIGWDAVPTIMQAIQLTIQTGVRKVIRES